MFRTIFRRQKTIRDVKARFQHKQIIWRPNYLYLNHSLFKHIAGREGGIIFGANFCPVQTLVQTPPFAAGTGYKIGHSAPVCWAPSFTVYYILGFNDHNRCSMSLNMDYKKWFEF